MKAFVLAVLAGLTMATVGHGDSIRVFHRDAKGRMEARSLSREKYERLVSGSILYTSRSILGSLRAMKPVPSGCEANAPKWRLRTVAVGLAFELSAGLGPVWTASVEPSARLIFSNSTDPAMP